MLKLCPEGDVNTRLPLEPFKGGFLKMAMTMDIPVLPMAIVGSEKVLSEPVRPRKLSHHIPHSCRVDLALLPLMRFENRVTDSQFFDHALEECRRLIAAKVEEILRQRNG